MAGPRGMMYNFVRQDTQETPLFERQMGNGESVELQQLQLVVDNLQHRIMNLEKINTDLEVRLEDQAKQSMAVEKECLLIEQRWKSKNDELLAEIEKWKTSFRQEKLKGDRLREQVHRSERELYGILQRKYELMRGPGTNKPNQGTHNKGPPGGNNTGSDGFNSRRTELPSASSMRENDFLLASNKVIQLNTSHTHQYLLLTNIIILYLKILQKEDMSKNKESVVLSSLADFLGF